MTELTFSAGERATLDLRDSSGAVVVQDTREGDEAVIRVAGAGDRTPFVLRERDTLRIRLEDGGTVSVPGQLALEVLVPPAVSLRLARSGGETVVKPVEPAATAGQAGAGAAAERGGTPPSPGDLSEFARVMSEYGRRILGEMTTRVRGSGFEASDEVAKRLDEAAERIDDQVQHVAQRVEREVERVISAVERTTRRAEEHARRPAEHAAHRTEERSRRMAERMAERAQRHAERARERSRGRAGRGRWWFTEKLDEFARAGSAVAGVGQPGVGAEPGPQAGPPPPRTVSPEERRAILEMLASGRITPDQAATLLDALGA
ncbi:MAG TPA: hypothetical protein VHS99_27385 [Chloroflexota bacterium]|nr:hypothetical protein [Chloroflexota bacterium]